MRPHERPADAFFEGLRRAGLDYRCTPEGRWGWDATCPACLLHARRTLRVTEHGSPGAPISLRCSNGCTELAVADALERTVVERAA